MATYLVTQSAKDLDASILHFASKNNIKIFDQQTSLRNFKNLNDKESIRALRRKMYYSKPEVKEKRKQYYENEEVKQKRKEYNQKHETKERKKHLAAKKRELLKKFRELHPEIFDESLPKSVVEINVNKSSD